MYENRTYRNLSKREGLVAFTATVKETDLHIQAKSNLKKKAIRAVLKARNMIESYALIDPSFLTSFVPVKAKEGAPAIVMEMIRAGTLANVGPMAAVAGAIAEFTGKKLMKASNEVIVENGGDIFMHLEKDSVFAIHAGDSILSMKIGVHIQCRKRPVSLCTSSGTLGHSKSFGRADAATVLSHSCALADAAATAIGNIVQTGKDIESAMEMGAAIPGITGIIIIKGENLGAWGDLELVNLT